MSMLYEPYLLSELGFTATAPRRFAFVICDSRFDGAAPPSQSVLYAATIPFDPAVVLKSNLTDNFLSFSSASTAFT